jgi:cofilin
MASGVAIADDCKNVFEEIKKNKTHRYCVFFIKDEKFITVEKLGGRDASYEEFLTDLQAAGEGECRYGLYDFEYEHQCQGTTESSKKQKLFLMSWCPDSAKIKKKMLYASSFETLKKSLVGVHKFIQATDASEASASEVEKQLRSTDRV